MLVAQKIHESKSLPSVQWLPAPRVKTNIAARSEAYSTLTRFFLKKNSPKMIPKSQKAFNKSFPVSDLESDLDRISVANIRKEDYRCLDYQAKSSEKKSVADDANSSISCQRKSDYRYPDFLCQKIDKNFQPDFENFDVGCHRRDHSEYRPQKSARICNANNVNKPNAFQSHHVLHSTSQNHLKSPKPENKNSKDTEHYELSFKSQSNFLFPLTEEQKFCSKLSEYSYKRSFDANADKSTHRSFDSECSNGPHSPLRYPSRALFSQQDLVRPSEFACADRRSALHHNSHDKRSSYKNLEGLIKCRIHSEPSVCNNIFLFADKREDKPLLHENMRSAEKNLPQKGSFIKRWRSLSILDLNSDSSFQSNSKASVKENVRKTEAKNPQAFYLLEDFLLPKNENGCSSKSRKMKNETFVSSFQENSLSPNSSCSGSEPDNREHLKLKRITEKSYSVYLPYRQSETHSFRNCCKYQDAKSNGTSSLSSPKSFLLPSSKKYTKPSLTYHTPKKDAADFKTFNGREAELSSSKVSPTLLENLNSTSEWEDMEHKIFTKEVRKNWEFCGKNGTVDADALKPTRGFKPQIIYGKKFADFSPSKYASISNAKCYSRSKQHRPEIQFSKQNLNCADKDCSPKFIKESCKSKKDESGMENGYKVPLTPSEALRYYGSKMSDYEKKEILQYPEIWFVGQDAKKINGEENGLQNGGYDDENGSYHKVLHDHISYRYEILGIIGKGSFGQVIKAQDHKTNHQALIEVRILDHLRRKEKHLNHGVIQMLDYFYFRNHLCISFELMGMNLYELIKRNNYQGFSLPTIRKFALSVVHCLKFLRNENVIHCDLKPENILLKDKGNMELKVIDFGSSCFVQKRIYTYIQSRFYRSPEVILGMSYGTSIDMWSLGCILAELCTGYPLFPGENEAEQLASIMEILGKPSENLLEGASRRRIFFDSKGNPRSITNSKGRKRRPASKDLTEVLKCTDHVFVDFVTRCLDWDPQTRMTPDEAINHLWLARSSNGVESVGSFCNSQRCYKESEKILVRSKRSSMPRSAEVSLHLTARETVAESLSTKNSLFSGIFVSNQPATS